MGLKDLLRTVSQGEQHGMNALLGFMNAPRYDKHVKHLKDIPAITGTKPKPRAPRVPSVPQRAIHSNVAAPTGSTGSPVADAQFQAFLQSIKSQESGGNYSAVGTPTRSGTALGAYQILDSNIDGAGGWDKETLGRDVSLDDFMSNPDLQEQIAQAKLSDYYRKYGAEGAAKAWYGGESKANANSNGQQYGGPSINDYAGSVVSRMRR